MEKFIIRDNLELVADKSLDFDIISTLVWGFCGKTVKCTIKEGNENDIYIGEATAIPLSEGDEYTVNVTKSGVAIRGNDKCCMLRGLMTFLMSVITEEPIDGIPVFSSLCNETHGKFKVKTRMVHICIFPETTFEMFRKLIRLSAVLQYTHIIIEFWGMLKYETLPELGWPCAFEKSDVKAVLDEARELGIIPIPMFNHFGHASQSRAVNGKHVVLDQNPSLAYLFTPDGWAWDIESEAVMKLLKSIREELYELFGDGEYIHLGCDEAYIYSTEYASREMVADFFKRITDECVAEGRLPMIWGDMFICKKEFGDTSDRYECNAKSIETAVFIRSKINKKTIINDWQYAVENYPWRSSKNFKTEGFTTMCCPWFSEKNISAAVNTVSELDLYGIVQTTWHVLSARMGMIFTASVKMGLPVPEKLSYSPDGMVTAALIRKISFESYSYEQSGFAAYQTGTDYRNDV